MKIYDRKIEFLEKTLREITETYELDQIEELLFLNCISKSKCKNIPHNMYFQKQGPVIAYIQSEICEILKNLPVSLSK